MSTRRSLSIYRIKDAINGDAVTDFNDVVQSPGTLTIYNLPDDAGIEARLFIDKPAESTPTWLGFLEEGFGEIEEIGKYSDLVARKGMFYELLGGEGIA